MPPPPRLWSGFGAALGHATHGFTEENPQVRVGLLRLTYAGPYEDLVISLRECSGAFDVVMLDDTRAPESVAAGWLRDHEALQNARARPRIPQWSQVESILGDYLQFVLIGQMTPERAVSEAYGRNVGALGR